MTTAPDVIAAARAWIDTPFEHQHRAKGIACDCAGLLIGVARELGIVAPEFDVNGYPRQPDGRTLVEICDRFMHRIPLEQAAPGCAAAFTFDADPAHLGILAEYRHGGLALVHASITAHPRRVVEHRLMQHARLRMVAAWRLPGVEWVS